MTTMGEGEEKRGPLLSKSPLIMPEERDEVLNSMRTEILKNRQPKFTNYMVERIKARIHH